MSNILDPDQARHFVGPDLGQNCLQRLSADDTSKDLNMQAQRYRSEFFTGLSEPLPLTKPISTKILCAGQNIPLWSLAMCSCLRL